MTKTNYAHSVVELIFTVVIKCSPLAHLQLKKELQSLYMYVLNSTCDHHLKGEGISVELLKEKSMENILGISLLSWDLDVNVCDYVCINLQPSEDWLWQVPAWLFTVPQLSQALQLWKKQNINNTSLIKGIFCLSCLQCFLCIHNTVQQIWAGNLEWLSKVFLTR